MSEGKQNRRPFKGRSCIDFPEDFCVVDIETTGLDPQLNDIIEIAGIKFVEGTEVDRFQTLVQPPLLIYLGTDISMYVDEYIENLTGITNAMLAEAPRITQALGEFEDFLGDDIIVGWNVNFDINFLYDSFEKCFERPMTNDFIDAMRIAKKLYPERKRYKLSSFARKYHLDHEGAHRAFRDAETTVDCFYHLREDAIAQYDSLEAFKNAFKKAPEKRVPRTIDPGNVNLDALGIDVTQISEDNPFFQQQCVATGKLARMTREEFAAIITALGGEFHEGSLTKNTNYLILGDNSACKTITDGKSSKQKKAEQYQLEGLPIEIITESVFYDMLADCGLE